MEKKCLLNEMFKGSKSLICIGVISIVFSIIAFALNFAEGFDFWAAAGVIAAVVGIILLASGIKISLNSKNTVSRYENSNKLHSVINDYNSESTVKIDKKGKVAFGERYLFALNCGRIYPYDEILWAYITVHKQNGVSISQTLTVCTVDGKKHEIVSERVTSTGSEKLSKCLSVIVGRNPDCCTGYTSANVKRYKAAVKENKAATFINQI